MADGTIPKETRAKETTAKDKQARILIWDLPVRLFHWTLVVLMATSYFSGQAGGDWMKLHFWSGYAILTLLLFRICWGFVGSTTARFRDFIKPPMDAIHHLSDLLDKGRLREIGHNPAGGAMVVVLLLAVLAQVVTGLFSADTDTGMVSGPLAKWLSDASIDKVTAFHHFWINVLLVLVGLHVLAVLVYFALKRLNLLGPMITGHKHVDDVVAPGIRPPLLKFVSSWRALAILIGSAIVVYLIVRLGG
ncbi:MAG: cytochrome b/b6 domain-containing protein [Alphaproteobacteria bacterium]|nr:cytochrome b/b6 domain-containing protein [Alphaproteobacteria bacterium]